MFNIGHITPLTLPLVFIYFFSILIIGYVIRNSLYKKENILRKYFLPALVVRMLGAIAIGAVYDLYYRGGDTFVYNYVNSKIADYILSGYISYFDLFEYDKVPLIYVYPDYTMFIAILSFPFYVVGLTDFYVSTLLLGAFSFIGTWLLFKTFYEIVPYAHRYLAMGILFIPNQVVWTSGLFKDNFCFFSIGIITYTIFLIVDKKSSLLYKMFMIVVSIIATFVIINIKSYILYSLIPFALLWIALRFKNKMHPLIRKFIYPVFLVVSVYVSYFILTNISTDSRWGLTNVLQFAVEHRKDLLKDYWYKGKSDDSRYDIGDFDPTLESILPKAPVAIATTFFRPFLWEAKNPLMLLAALESFFVLSITIYVILKVGIFRLIYIIIYNDDIKFTLGYALFFGFFVGLTSANFGNLVRYKTPALPFYFISLAIIYYYGYYLHNAKTSKNQLIITQ